MEDDEIRMAGEHVRAVVEEFEAANGATERAQRIKANARRAEEARYVFLHLFSSFFLPTN